jgi:hypothetical protein
MALLLCTLTLLLGLVSNVHAQNLTTISDFGWNPTNLTLQVYVPTTLAHKPAVIMAVGNVLVSEPSSLSQ